MGLGQGLSEFTEPSGDTSPTGDRGDKPLLDLLWSKGEPGNGGEPTSELKDPAVGGRYEGERLPDLHDLWRPMNWEGRESSCFIYFSSRPLLSFCYTFFFIYKPCIFPLPSD